VSNPLVHIFKTSLSSYKYSVVQRETLRGSAIVADLNSLQGVKLLVSILTSSSPDEIIYVNEYTATVRKKKEQDTNEKKPTHNREVECLEDIDQRVKNAQ
jgi:uncharacterized ion transporter superfamily protein YfcC